MEYSNFTVKELIDRAVAIIRYGTDYPLRREHALAITKLEEAQMWYTRGRAIEEGVFNPKDLDKKNAELSD